MFRNSSAVDETAVASALSGLNGVFIEAGCQVPKQQRRLTLVMRTCTAFGLPLAAIFTKALRCHIDISQLTADAIELALQEALANAIIHGNLGMGSEERGNPDTYGQFCTTLAERLEDPVTATRMIQIVARWRWARLSLAVGDQGGGFQALVSSRENVTAYGRGLDIVRSVAKSVFWNQKRRRLVIGFDISHKSGV